MLSLLRSPSGDRRRAMDRRGFTLVEMMITLTVLAVVMVVLMAVMYAAQRSRSTTSNRVESAQAARAAIDMMARDLRSAGYGADRDWVAAPQPPLAYVDSLQVLINANFQPYPDPDPAQPPLAYRPDGNPRPAPLNGTTWQPPLRYRTGAEIVRWTLDVNNDGQVNGDDVANANGVDARRTPNPDDFVLVRQVYGDSTGNIAGNNGGQMERIALVRRPGGGVAPMFTVYLRGDTDPWDWSNGPVPVGQLQDIERIVIQVAAPSGRPDAEGHYAQTSLRTEVNSLRNVPNFGVVEYAVDGWVFNDLDHDDTKDSGEPGLPDAIMRLGNGLSTVTDVSGYFIFHVPEGTYTLRQLPPAGYGVFTSPDSFVVHVGPAQRRSFADTARAGGWVKTEVYDDTDGDGTLDAGEPWLRNVRMTMSPGGEVQYTDVNGSVTLFAPVGDYAVNATPPDSFAATTPNPVTGTMSNGGTASHQIGMTRTPMGELTGRVFRDNNRNGALDTGEGGIPNVWVGVTPDAGVTVLGYQYTNANGDFDIKVPINNPPGTKPYYITVIPPPGYYPTSTTSVGPLLLSQNQVIPNNNFGMLGYQIITLNASRVLSLASGDLIEKDWSGSDAQWDTKGHQDADLVLGADAGGTDNISVWFNQYDTSPMFDPNPTYTRNAPQSVLALALDTLDTNPPKKRPDVVTGTKTTASGNFFVWFNQNSGGNLGYLPTTFSPSQNYRTNDNGDVQAVVTLDCAGGITKDQPDIVVGTKSSTAGQGSLEVWSNNNAATPTFARLETYPSAGAIPGNKLGEVTGMAVTDFNLDGIMDLVVGTRLDNTSGQLMFFRGNAKGTGTNRFTYQVGYALSGAVTALTVCKVDGDLLPDVILGLQTAADAGELHFWRNQYAAGVWDFSLKKKATAPGLVLSLANGDFGGSTNNDLAIGWRQNETSYVGGVQIYFLDSGTLPSFGTDPSGGSVVNMVPALNVNNFNYGVHPALPTPPFLTDLAAGVKISPTTGALVVFIR